MYAFLSGRELAECEWDLADSRWDLAECEWDLADSSWDLTECGCDLADGRWYLAECGWDLAEHCRVVWASDCQCLSRNVLGPIESFAFDTVESERRQMKQSKPRHLIEKLYACIADLRQSQIMRHHIYLTLTALHTKLLFITHTVQSKHQSPPFSLLRETFLWKVPDL
jgi:hypothetical protein